MIVRALGLGTRRSIHVVERNRLIFRRTWLYLVTGLLEPLFFLLGAGFGLGALVGPVIAPGGTPVPYASFVAPALVATAVMTGVVYDSHNAFYRLRYERAYDGMVATPLTAADITFGEIAWAITRGTLYASGCLAVMLPLGLLASPLAILAVPAAMLIGLAAGAAGLLLVTFMRTRHDLDWFAVATLPLFLFSGTFFPISAYAEPLRTLIEISPLYRGVDLMRGLTTGSIGWSQAVDVVYLAVLGVLLLLACSRRLNRMLLK